MQNGQPKPGYNIQIPTNTQYIVNYTAAQTTAVTTTLKGHLTEYHGGFNESPDNLTADAGYGSEENHQTLEDNQIEGFVKYNYFHKEQRQAKNCQGCPLRGMCHKAQGNPIIERNYKLVRHKQKAKARLLSQQGIAKRKQRCWDAEAVESVQ